MKELKMIYNVYYDGKMYFEEYQKVSTIFNKGYGFKKIVHLNTYPYNLDSILSYKEDDDLITLTQTYIVFDFKDNKPVLVYSDPKETIFDKKSNKFIKEEVDELLEIKRFEKDENLSILANFYNEVLRHTNSNVFSYVNDSLFNTGLGRNEEQNFQNFKLIIKYADDIEDFDKSLITKMYLTEKFEDFLISIKDGGYMIPNFFMDFLNNAFDNKTLLQEGIQKYNKLELKDEDLQKIIDFLYASANLDKSKGYNSGKIEDITINKLADLLIEGYELDKLLTYIINHFMFSEVYENLNIDSVITKLLGYISYIKKLGSEYDRYPQNLEYANYLSEHNSNIIKGLVDEDDLIEKEENTAISNHIRSFLSDKFIITTANTLEDVKQLSSKHLLPINTQVSALQSKEKLIYYICSENISSYIIVDTKNNNISNKFYILGDNEDENKELIELFKMF